MPCDHRALDLEQEMDALVGFAERLIVALPLGDDQVGGLEAASERYRACFEDRARRVGAVPTAPWGTSRPRSTGRAWSVKPCGWSRRDCHYERYQLRGADQSSPTGR